MKIKINQLTGFFQLTPKGEIPFPFEPLQENDELIATKIQSTYTGTGIVICLVNKNTRTVLDSYFCPEDSNFLKQFEFKESQTFNSLQLSYQFPFILRNIKRYIFQSVESDLYELNFLI